MASEADPACVCEVVGVFHTAEDLEAAIDELLASGYDRAALSLLATEDAVAKKLGAYYHPAGELADDPAVPRGGFVSTAAIGDAEGGLIGGLAYLGATVAVGAVILSGGALAATIAAAVFAGGTGGLIGSALARWVGHHHGAYLHAQIENGGLLLWVRAWNSQDEARAIEIVSKHAADKSRARHLHGCRLMQVGRISATAELLQNDGGTSCGVQATPSYRMQGAANQSRQSREAPRCLPGDYVASLSNGEVTAKSLKRVVDALGLEPRTR